MRFIRKIKPIVSESFHVYKFRVQFNDLKQFDFVRNSSYSENSITIKYLHSACNQKRIHLCHPSICVRHSYGSIIYHETTTSFELLIIGYTLSSISLTNVNAALRDSNFFHEHVRIHSVSHSINPGNAHSIIEIANGGINKKS